MGSLTLDIESKSYADLKKVGAWVYSTHPTTDIICLCYQIGDGPIRAWRPGITPPDDLWEAVAAGHTVEVHNLSFESSMWVNILTPRYGWPAVRPEQWRDTMAVAAYYGLPAAVDKLAKVLGFGGKDPEGARLITKYSKLHLKTAKTEIPDADYDKFANYCAADVRQQRLISNFLGDLPERELPIFLHDQVVNTRGLLLDLEGVAVAADIVDQRSQKLTDEFQAIVGYSPGQRAKVMEWFAEQGFPLENMQADYLEGLLEDEENGPTGLPRRALAIRLSINKASTKKLDAMARNACPLDSRARWQTRYHGAFTGRTTGSGFQPLNLTRGWEKLDPEQLVRDIMYGDAEYLDALYGDAMAAVSRASRHWIRAAEGHRIIAGDFVSIEAVVLACLAGEQWKIDAFARGDKIYELMGDKIYDLPHGTVTKDTHPLERFDGKTGELAFGYAGGLQAWLNFDNSGRHTDERIREICKAWRHEHPATVALWAGLNSAAIAAVRTGSLQGYRQIGFEVVDDWLTMVLPDGKRIWYYKPQLRAKMPPWHTPALKEACADGVCTCKPGVELSYMAQKLGQWLRVGTHGGKLAENACQAVSRQILAPAALALEKHGYPVILTVYDEVVTEPAIGFGSREEVERIMQDNAGGEWSRLWPIRADAWEGGCYRK